DELAEAIATVEFKAPVCPVYQNVDGKPHTDPEEIKANLVKQLTAPVRWTYDVEAMIADGADEFIELGPGSVLQGLVKKINRNVATSGKQ
ncbi:MAG: [acyl-carrier-protein] S-malonyltransferase, partial [Muribaculaceae bacterium]|nr:[acyl-carrier-protein] S-malonyltransferase [Muribaculaceae bacterium]